MSNDAWGCCDWIAHIAILLALCRLGIPHPPILDCWRRSKRCNIASVLHLESQPGPMEVTLPSLPLKAFCKAMELDRPVGLPYALL